MELQAMRGATGADKAESFVNAFPSAWAGRVLDVGCRDRELEDALAHRGLVYVGLDLSTTGDVVADLGAGLPFRDRTAEVVVALDVLEHTDDIHLAFGELCRVARRYVILSLPNQYEARARWMSLRGRHSGKWGLPPVPRRDRHRWLFTLQEAREFCHHRAREHGWVVVEERALVGPKRSVPLARVLVQRWPGLLAPTYIAFLEPTRRC
jgi:hypothetical protein